MSGAVKHTVDMVKRPSFSASQSKGGPCTQAKGRAQCNAKERAQGYRERSKRKREDYDADISKDDLEISTRCNKRVSPTKGSTIQRDKARPRDKRPDEPVCGKETVSFLVNDQKSKQKKISVGKLKGSTNPGKETNSSTVPQKESGKKVSKKCPVQRRKPVTSKTVQDTSTDLQAESPEADTDKGNVHRVSRSMMRPMPDFEENKDRKRKRTSTSEDSLYEGTVKHTVDMVKRPSFSASQIKGGPYSRAKGRAQCNAKGRAQCNAKGRAQGNHEGNIKTQEDSNADVSKDILQIPTRCDTGVSPTKGSIAQNIQRNKARPQGKRPNEPVWGNKTVSDVSFLVKDEKSKQKNISVGKLKGCTNPGRETDSSTVSQKESWKKGTKKCPVQRRQPVISKTVHETNTDLQAESPEADTEKGNVHTVPRYMKHPMPDFDEEKELSSSELSMDISSPEYVDAVFSSQDDTEDVHLPVVMLQKDEAVIIPGSFVWCKYQHFPYWPSLVKMVDIKHKKASVVFVEKSISDPTKKKMGIKVALRTIKHYDCPEKQQFLENARKDFGNFIDWCDSLISDYRIRLGCGSFSGSFLDYCTADISLPVRREMEGGKREVIFPEVDTEVAKAQQDMFNSNPKMNRKLLPDRSRAARDRANEKLVMYIVNAKEAENHLKDILAGKKKSQWLKKFQSSKRHINCLDTYIEDEQQIELVMDHLQAVCVKMSGAAKNLMHGDQTRFIFEVLIPESVIFAIAATEQMSYREAEAKYLKGPLVSKRERRMFEEQILEKKKSTLVKETKIKKDLRE